MASSKLDILANSKANKWLIVVLVSLLFLLTLWPVERFLNYSFLALSAITILFLFVGTAMLIIQKKSIPLHPMDIIVTLWYVYIAGLYLLDTVFPSQEYFLKATQFFCLYIAVRMVASASGIDANLLLISVTVCTVIECLIGIGQCLGLFVSNPSFLMTGTFQNPGPFSAYLLLGLVSSCVLRNRAEGKLKRAFTATALLCAVFLPGTWSRAAWISATTCLLLLYRKTIGKKVFWLLPIVVTFFVFAYFLKQDSANGRIVIYFISLRAFLHHPVFGGGLGSFANLFAEETACLYSSGLPIDFKNVDAVSFAFNDILGIGVEQGFIGILFAVAFILTIFLNIKKNDIGLLYPILSLVLFSLFSYPFELLPFQVLMVLFASVSCSGVSRRAESQYNKPLFRAIILAAFGVFISIHSIDKINRIIDAQNDFRLIEAYLDESLVDDCYELYPELKGNVNYLNCFALLLRSIGLYNDSNSILRQGTKVSNSSMLYVLQGENYHDMGDNIRAEECYKKAFSIMPNRLYPLYKLMLLYDEENSLDKTRDMAAMVVSFNEKVVSEATNEMKERAANILSESNLKHDETTR